MEHAIPKHEGYSASHCWYYLLGGDVLNLKDIKIIAESSDYKGCCHHDVDKIERMAEPKRTQKLRELHHKFNVELKRDISGYRAAVRELNKHRSNDKNCKPPKSAGGVHVAMSLKFSHLYNDFAHLHYLDDLLTRQLDLFGD